MSSVTALPFAAWPTGRKVAAGTFAMLGYIALACAAVYLAGVLFLVLNKANPKQAQFTSILHYWDLYADDAPLRKKLQLAIGASGIGLLVLLPAGLVAAAQPRRALHGDARFAMQLVWRRLLLPVWRLLASLLSGRTLDVAPRATLRHSSRRSEHKGHARNWIVRSEY